MLTAQKQAELIDLGIKEMVDSRKRLDWYPFKNMSIGTGGQNALMGYIAEDGITKESNTYPCHNPISYYKNAGVLWSGWGWRGKKEIAEKFFTWLLEESPWSKTGIIPKLDKEFMWNEGFIWGNLRDTPANVIHNFLIASRMCAEWPHRIADWYHLVVDYNINPAFAFLFLTCVIDYSQGNSPFRPSSVGTVFATADKYDWPLDMGRGDETYVKNFIFGKAVGPSKVGYSPDAITKPVNTLWGPLPTGHTKKAYACYLKNTYLPKYGKPKVNECSPVFGSRTNPLDDLRVDYNALVEIIKLENERLFK